METISRKNGIKTKKGELKPPFFMPDATRAFVKSLGIDDLQKVGVGAMVVNTYHLYLQPGIELIKKAGGINKFMNWEQPLLSDSGGYQVFSLIHKNPKMGKIKDEKVIFKSPLDGSKHELTPEKSIQIQFDLGVDMMVVLDDCPPNSFSYNEIKKSVERTVNWARRGMIEYKKQLKVRKIKDEDRPLIFGVIQGGTYLDLRKECAERLVEIGFSTKGGPALSWDGLGFGARHHDENGNLMEELLKFTIGLIPENYLRFALGVGTPGDIVKCAKMGWDMFDCVIPTREGRHGRLFLWKRNPKSEILNPKQNIKQKSKLPIADYELQNSFYETININNEKFKTDFSPIDPACGCELCRNYSKAYLRHLFAAKDPLAMRLASIHNLKFYMDLMKSLKSG